LYSVFQRTVKYKLIIRRLIARMWSTTRRQLQNWPRKRCRCYAFKAIKLRHDNANGVARNIAGALLRSCLSEKHSRCS